MKERRENEFQKCLTVLITSLELSCRMSYRGGARGWLGAIALSSEHTSPRRKAIFSEIFGIYSTLKTIF